MNIPGLGRSWRHQVVPAREHLQTEMLVGKVIYVVGTKWTIKDRGRPVGVLQTGNCQSLFSFSVVILPSELYSVCQLVMLLQQTCSAGSLISGQLPQLHVSDSGGSTFPSFTTPCTASSCSSHSNIGSSVWLVFGTGSSLKQYLSWDELYRVYIHGEGLVDCLVDFNVV